MIQRLSIPDRSGFSTSNSYAAPYYDKFTTPRFLIRYADSVYTERNEGMDVYWYTSTTNARTEKATAFSSRFPIAKFYYANGYPPFFTKLDAKANWACKFKTKFYNIESSDYTFYFGGSGKIVECKIAGLPLTILGQTLSMGNTTYASSETLAGVVGGTWSTLEFTYSSEKRNDPPNNEYGLVALWRNTNTYTEPIPLSAGLCVPYNKTTITNTRTTLDWHTIYPITDISYNKEKGGIATLNFDLPFIHTSNYNYNGYFHSAGELIYSNPGGLRDRDRIKQYRLVEYYEGYATPTGVEYAKKFTGQIKNFTNDYQSNAIGKIKVACEDFGSFLKESFNQYSPTPIDYWQVGYINPRGSGNQGNAFVAGDTKPNTFDGWDIHKFVHVALTESYIDPFLFYNKKTFTGHNLASKTGQYKILYTTAGSNALKFPVGFNYGNTRNVTQQSDDKYNYAIGTGEFWHDVTKNFLNPYYYDLYFDEHGHPSLSGNNIPFSVIPSNSWNQISTWSSGTNYKCIKAAYHSSRSATNTAGSDFTGKACDLVFMAGPRYGKSNYSAAPADASVKIVVKYPATGTLFTTYANLYASTTRGYYDGVDPDIGYNPCVVHIGDATMKYDTYRVVIDAENSYPVFLNALVSYDRDSNTPDIIVESSDINSKGAIVDLAVDTQARDLRNDVYVYGNLIGDITARSNDETKVTINPNNPVRRYVYSIARDVASQYSSSASNFVGRPLKLLIQDPKIVNYDQADSIAYNVLTAYNRPNKKVDLTILGNPLIQIGDCIGVKDNYTKYVSTNDPVWVEGISTDIQLSDKGVRYLTKLETTPTKPPDSWWAKPDPTFTGNAIKDVKLYNNGRMVALSAAVSSTQTVFNLVATPGIAYTAPSANRSYRGTECIPERGYLRIYHTTGSLSPTDARFNFEVQNSAKEYPYRAEEIIYYEKTTADGFTATAQSCRIKNVIRGTWGSYATSHAANCKFYAAIDPYVADATNTYPAINFNLLASGKVRVQVWGITPLGPYLVDTLTGIGKNGSNWPYDGYDELTWGNYTYYWSCCDQIGAYNNIMTFGEIKKGGFYASEYDEDKGGWIDSVWKTSESSFDPNDIREFNYTTLSSKDSYLKDGKFYFTIDLMPTGKTQNEYTYNTKPVITNMAMDTTMGLVYIKRNPVGCIGIRVATAGLYHNYEPAAGEVNCRYLHSARTISSKDGSLSWKQFPYIHNTARATDVNAGLTFTFQDYSPSVYATSYSGSNRSLSRLVNHPQREYLMDVQYNLATYVYGAAIGNYAQWTTLKRTGNLTKNDQWLDLHNGGLGRQYVFNPKTWHDGNDLSWFPPAAVEGLRGMEAKGYFYDLRDTTKIKTGSWVFVNNFIFLSGFIYDKSGRTAWIYLPFTNENRTTHIALNNMYDKADYQYLPRQERNLISMKDVGKTYMYRLGKSLLSEPLYTYTKTEQYKLCITEQKFAHFLQWGGCVGWYDKEAIDGGYTATSQQTWGGWEESTQGYWGIGGNESIVRSHFDACGNKSIFHAKDVAVTYHALWFEMPITKIVKLLGK